MLSLSNISLKAKLVLILLFPILGLTIFAGLQSFDYYDKYKSMQKIETLTVLSQKISRLVHETQKERGMTAGYIGSKGKKFKYKLPTQRELSNKNYEEFKTYSQSIDFSIYPTAFKNNIDKTIDKFEELSEIRSKVNQLEIPTSKALAYYTKMNALILNNVKLIAKLSSDAQISREVSAYANFLLSKERAGIERAVGTDTLGRDSFDKGMRTKLTNLITAQDNYMSTFLDLANENAKDFYKKTMQGNDINEVVRIRKSLFISEQKQQLVSQMKELVGYGGIIHNFKNYVIRGNDKYEKKVKNQYKTLLVLINKYKTIGKISNEEKNLLNNIQNVFAKYFNGLSDISIGIQNNNSVKQLDKVIKVSDTPAIKALSKLSNSLFSDSAEYWFSQITSKINKLKAVDNQLSLILIKNTNFIKDDVYNGLILILVGSIISLFLALLLGFIISKKIALSLNNFVEGLDNFFDFLNYKIKDVELINNNDSDEFGQMAKKVNENITQTKENILEDRKLIDETIEVSNKINKGYLDGKITVVSANPALNELKDILNSMIRDLNNTLINIEDVLNSYINLDYRPLVDKNNMEGVIEGLIDGINTLGETITTDLIKSKRNGLTLQSSAKTLSANVDNLTNSSNDAAASLEETAAALEEITGTIINNTDNVSLMATYASKVTSSANKGEELAANTMSAMDEINDQVSSINEAITVIDKIAFQTNILSLNAAVEAATAGEAGKGFAVVAQEVRNLASRSAEAAREIKGIVETATQKANTGKDITKDMLDGYKDLNTDISKTLELINDVDAASKEQQSGIEQINDAVTQLDQQTQMNAAAALETNDIAISTEKLAESIIKKANMKEFRGKDDVEDRRDNCRDLDYNNEEKRRAEAHIKETCKTRFGEKTIKIHKKERSINSKNIDRRAPNSRIHEKPINQKQFESEEESEGWSSF